MADDENLRTVQKAVEEELYGPGLAASEFIEQEEKTMRAQKRAKRANEGKRVSVLPTNPEGPEEGKIYSAFFEKVTQIFTPAQRDQLVAQLESATEGYGLTPDQKVVYAIGMKIPFVVDGQPYLLHENGMSLESFGLVEAKPQRSGSSMGYAEKFVPDESVSPYGQLMQASAQNPLINVYFDQFCSATLTETFGRNGFKHAEELTTATLLHKAKLLNQAAIEFSQTDVARELKCPLITQRETGRNLANNFMPAQLSR